MNTVKYYKFQLRLRPSRHNIKATFGLLTALALSGMNANLPAQQPAPATANTDKEVISVTVEATAEQPGKFVLGQEELSMSPSPTGTVNEVLRARSSIQFDLTSRNSMLGGEITPPRVSIAGGKFYENNFLVDGISINSQFDFTATNGTNSDSLSPPTGEPESFFIDPDLIGELTVYTSSVPAEYGSFTGGVISAKTRNPKTDSLHFSLKYRHTRDSWARQHYKSENMSDRSTTASYQPRFKKHDYSIFAEGPLSKKISAFASYSEKRSEVPQYDLTARADEHVLSRVNRNLMVKLATYDLNNFKASLTSKWMPYHSEGITAGRINSDYKTKGGGLSFDFDTENVFDFGILENKLAFQSSELSRTGSGTRIYSWRQNAANGYANWGTGTSATATAQEGSFGDYTQDKRQYTIKPTLRFNTFGGKNFKNTITIGGELYYMDYIRETSGTETYSWLASVSTTSSGPLNTAATGAKENGVIEGEQWLNYRVVYDAERKNLSVKQAAFFVEDVIRMGRVTFRPGLRFSYDDISDNVDIAPRTMLNVDVFNDGFLNLSGGYNRYYGSQLVNYALYKSFDQKRQGRTSWDQPWTSVSDYYVFTRRLGDMDTPYKDEFSLGASINIKDTLFRVEGVLRKGHDEIRAIKDPLKTNNSRMLANTGSSEYKGFTFEIEKAIDLKWAGRHNLLFSATWSETETDSRLDLAYDEGANGISPIYAVYNGKLVTKDEMPASNFNSPWILTLRDMIKLNKGRLRLFNTLRFEEGGFGTRYINVHNASNNPDNYQPSPDGLTIYNFEDGTQKDIFYYDFTVEYDLIKYKKGTLTARIEILNVFDRKNSIE